MANIFDQMKRRLREGVTEAGPPSAEGVATQPEAPPAANAVDARRIAEQKAEEAGRKWRAKAEASGAVEKEIGGPQGLEPTRYGDWEKAGRCFDF